MTNRKNSYSTLALLTLLTLFMSSSCKRDFNDLEPATYPTTAEVFIDGFSAGLDYSAYGDSYVSAFQVDEDISYKGTASMRFDVPDADSPKGSYAGGQFIAEGGRNLSGYNALTFWGKASQGVNIGELGFAGSGFKVALLGAPFNTTWKQYIIPIPDPSKLTLETILFSFAATPLDGKGYSFWIDEVKFEKLGTLANPRPAILEGQDQFFLAETGDKFPLGGLSETFNMPTGVDQRIEVGPGYFTFTSSETSVANVNNQGVVSVIDAGTAVITATLAGIEAAGSFTLESAGEAVLPLTAGPTPTVSPDSVISMFSNAYTNVPVDTWNTGWQFSTAELTDLQINGDDVKRYKKLNFVGIEFSSQTINASQMTHFHMDIWTPDLTDLPAAFKVLLVDFGPDGSFDGGDDSSHEVSFTSPTLATESWVSLDIPMSSFAGLASRAHLAQLVLSGDLPTVFVDNVYFYNSGATEPTVPTVAAPTPTQNPGT
ncbi:MAG: glycosyl hydrolase family 16 [Saprospirales bacterium]|nr:glycosyl hydrolase family 16 [Saprospirales bacterium]